MHDLTKGGTCTKWMFFKLTHFTGEPGAVITIVVGAVHGSMSHCDQPWSSITVLMKVGFLYGGRIA